MVNNRISTGINGLDMLLEGGLIKNRVVLVQGAAGTGKSTLGLQYLVHGAQELKEPGVLLTLEYEPTDIIADSKQFGWNVKRLMDIGLIKITSPPGGFEDPKEMKIDEVINFIHECVKEVGAKRLVIDSMNSLEVSLAQSNINRRELLRFISLIRDLDCTTLILAEKEVETGDLMYAYMAHGVIEMYNIKRGANRLRGIEIVKMRGTEHSNLTHSMQIVRDVGIEVLPHEVDLAS